LRLDRKKSGARPISREYKEQASLASPARAASTAAFRASTLAWKASSSITLMILPMRSTDEFRKRDYHLRQRWSCAGHSRSHGQRLPDFAQQSPCSGFTIGRRLSN